MLVRDDAIGLFVHILFFSSTSGRDLRQMLMGETSMGGSISKTWINAFAAKARHCGSRF